MCPITMNQTCIDPFLAQFLHQVRLINLSGYAGDRLCTVEQHW